MIIYLFKSEYLLKSLWRLFLINLMKLHHDWLPSKIWPKVTMQKLTIHLQAIQSFENRFFFPNHYFIDLKKWESDTLVLIYSFKVKLNLLLASPNHLFSLISLFFNRLYLSFKCINITMAVTRELKPSRHKWITYFSYLISEMWTFLERQKKNYLM